jgi:hypothetical protein
MISIYVLVLKSNKKYMTSYDLLIVFLSLQAYVYVKKRADSCCLLFRIKQEEIFFFFFCFFIQNTIHYSRSKKIKFHDEIDVIYHDIVVLLIQLSNVTMSIGFYKNYYTGGFSFFFCYTYWLFSCLSKYSR